MTSTDRKATRRPRRTTAQADAHGGADVDVAGTRPDTPGGSGSPAQWMLGVFIVLALIASVLMVVSDDLSLTASIAVIAALWAAVIGAILVTKYRRQAEVAETRTRDQRLVYELQLEREIAARRQYEAEVENAVRHELAEETNEEFEALKAQVLALRASLEKLLGNPLPEVPLALRPERRRELGSGLSGATYAAAADDRVAANLDFATTEARTDGRHAPDVVDVEPESESAVEMTEIIPVVTDEAVVDYATEEVEADEPVAGVYQAGEYQEAEYTAQAYGAAGHAEQQYGEQQYGEPQYGEPQYTEVRYSEVQYSAAQYSEQPQYSEQSQYAGQQYAEQQYPDQPQYTEQYGAPYGRPYDAAAYQPPAVPPVPQVPPMPQRGGRGVAEDAGAHTAGQPASELLDRLRASRGEAGPGGRRRRD